jgi:hypothetical protein
LSAKTLSEELPSGRIALVIRLVYSDERSSTRPFVSLLFTVLALSLLGASDYRDDAHNGIVNVQMHNVVYHFTNEIAEQIPALQGKLVPFRGNPIPVFDDKNSFTLRISDARFVISSRSMASVLNSHVFAAPDSPLQNISVHV